MAVYKPRSQRGRGVVNRSVGGGTPKPISQRGRDFRRDGDFGMPASREDAYSSFPTPPSRGDVYPSYPEGPVAAGLFDEEEEEEPGIFDDAMGIYGGDPGAVVGGMGGYGGGFGTGPLRQDYANEMGQAQQFMGAGGIYQPGGPEAAGLGVSEAPGWQGGQAGMGGSYVGMYGNVAPSRPNQSVSPRGRRRLDMLRGRAF